MPDIRRTAGAARERLTPLRGRWLRAPVRLPTDLRERAGALLLLVVVALVAGLTLGHSADRLEELPGLLLMVPAAIALRGNIFGALGSRLGTAIHTGTFRLSLRPSSVVGENVMASMVLTIVSSMALAALAKGAAVVFGVGNSISIGEFVVVSLLGGLLASVTVLVTALALTAGSVRFGWDPDNVTAPMVTAVGDVATVPALVLAAGLVGDTASVGIIGVVGLVSVPVMGVLVVRHGRPGLRSIIRESMPVLLIGIMLDLVAGVTVEKQIVSFALFPALLVLLPAFLAVAGALGGTLSSRLGTQLHLGIVTPQRVPEASARREIGSSIGLAAPIFAACGLLAHLFASSGDLVSPGAGWMVVTALSAGLVASLLAAVIAYYSTIGSVRIGLDPDTYGIPLVTSTLDLLGALTLILVIELLGFV